MSQVWSGGSTRRWRRIRLEVLELNRIRNGGRCRAKVRKVCTVVATVAHHIKGRKVTGDDIRFIAAACAPCNIHIGDPATHPYNCPQCVDNEWAKERNPQPRRMTEW